MRVNTGRAVANAIMATFGGAMAGGAAGGATMVLVENFPDVSRAISLYAAVGGLVIYLWGAFAGAFLGTIGGLMFGLLPTFVLGSLLGFVRNVGPFRHLAVWAAIGALAGIGIYAWSPYGSPSGPHSNWAWGAAWAVGGATAMTVYWLAGIGRNFAPKVAR